MIDGKSIIIIILEKLHSIGKGSYQYSAHTRIAPKNTTLSLLIGKIILSGFDQIYNLI